MNVFVSGLLLLNSLNGVWLQAVGTPCLTQFDSCLEDVINENGELTQDDVDQIHQARLTGGIEPLIDRIGKDKICILIKTYGVCALKLRAQCENDPSTKMLVYIMVKSGVKLGCEGTHFGSVGYCPNKSEKCVNLSLVTSGLPSKDYNDIRKVETLETAIDAKIEQIGIKKFCEFAESFRQCHDKIKDECKADDSSFKPILQLSELVHGQLKCGCVLTMSSMALTLISIFLNFKSTL